MHFPKLNYWKPGQHLREVVSKEYENKKNNKDSVTTGKTHFALAKDVTSWC